MSIDPPNDSDRGLDDLRDEIRSRPGAAERIAADVDQMNQAHIANAPGGGVGGDSAESARHGAGGYRDHDHAVEDLLITDFEDPTPQNQAAAGSAVALLQRRYDHVLRRIDGTGEVPLYPVHAHDPSIHPVDCLDAVLHELAGAVLADRAETLAHGLEAARSLQLQRDLARRVARQLWVRDPRPITVGGWQLPEELPWLLTDNNDADDE